MPELKEVRAQKCTCRLSVTGVYRALPCSLAMFLPASCFCLCGFYVEILPKFHIELYCLLTKPRVVFLK